MSEHIDHYETPVIHGDVSSISIADIAEHLEQLTVAVTTLIAEQTAIRELLTQAVEQVGPVLEKMQKNPLLRGFLG